MNDIVNQIQGSHEKPFYFEDNQVLFMFLCENVLFNLFSFM